METNEIEKILWTNLLNRIEIEKNASHYAGIKFFFDKGDFEGVNLVEFQMKAMKRLKGMGTFASLDGLYDRPKLELAVMIGRDMLLPRPVGYEIEFIKSNEAYHSVIHLLRTALESGGINATPIFEFKLIKRDVIIHDFEQECDWHIHKMNLDSAAHQVLELMLKEGRFDVTRKDLGERHIAVKNLGDMIGEIKFVGDLKKLFFEATRDRLILYKIVTVEHLSTLGLTSASIRKQLKAIDKA